MLQTPNRPVSPPKPLKAPCGPSYGFLEAIQMPVETIR